MNYLSVLKKVRRGLTNPKHFNGSDPGKQRPHCIIGEMDLVTNNADWDKKSLFTLTEENILNKALRHKTALRILDAAIKRLEKKEARR